MPDSHSFPSMRAPRQRWFLCPYRVLHRAHRQALTRHPPPLKLCIQCARGFCRRFHWPFEVPEVAEGQPGGSGAAVEKEAKGCGDKRRKCTRNGALLVSVAYQCPVETDS
jgi:hypothetical protein